VHAVTTRGSGGASGVIVGDDGDVQPMPEGRALVGRLLLVAVVAMGLVGMHHLVVAGCAQLGITASSQGGHGGHGLADAATPVPAPGLASMSAPMEQVPLSGGAAHAAIICLAVLLLIVLLRPPGVLGVLHQVFGRWRIAAAAWMQRVVEPPDLIQLSISRT
jgi:hypothetical protein